MGGFGSIGHWVVLLLVVLLIFGTKKLRNIGQDLGAGIKGFKDGMKDGSAENKVVDSATPQVTSGQTIEGEIKEKSKS